MLEFFHWVASIFIVYQGSWFERIGYSFSCPTLLWNYRIILKAQTNLPCFFPSLFTFLPHSFLLLLSFLLSSSSSFPFFPPFLKILLSICFVTTSGVTWEQCFLRSLNLSFCCCQELHGLFCSEISQDVHSGNIYGCPNDPKLRKGFFQLGG